MVDAIDRIALLTGRPDVPEYKQARGYTWEPDKFAAAGLSPEHRGDGLPAAVAESLVQLERARSGPSTRSTARTPGCAPWRSPCSARTSTRAC